MKDTSKKVRHRPTVRKQNMFLYRITQIASVVASKIMFKKRILRNEIKNVKGPFVVIANHQSKLDFVNLIGATRQPMHFVVSDSFYNTLPVKGIMNKIGVIPKQQFQTTLKDLMLMKSVIEEGRILVIYPAGLMSEDGLSTPIPEATYKFLQWLEADVYVAKTSGTYFAMPKWARKKRPGRTYLDIYKLFSKEKLHEMSINEIKDATDNALLFDAYREQENLLIKYKGNSNIEGLENVLYMCPNCKKEFTISVKDRTKICCSCCGFEQECDEFAFMHNSKGIGEEIRYVSDWSKIIYNELKEKIENDENVILSTGSTIQMIDPEKHKFVDVGNTALLLTRDGFKLYGFINGEEVRLTIPIKKFASLPFSPGKYIELQHGEVIYRCLLDDGKLAMKFINMVKIFYELNLSVHKRT